MSSEEDPKEIADAKKKAFADLKGLVGSADYSDMDIRLHTDVAPPDPAQLIVPVHSAFLMCRCQFLRDLISIEKATNPPGTRVGLELIAHSREDMLALLSFLYVGDSSGITGENIDVMKEMAERFDLPSLLTVCRQIESAAKSSGRVVGMAKALEHLESALKAPPEGGAKDSSSDRLKKMSEVAESFAEVVDFYRNLKAEDKPILLQLCTKEGDAPRSTRPPYLRTDTAERIIRVLAAMDFTTLQLILEQDDLRVNEVDLYEFVRDFVSGRMGLKTASDRRSALGPFMLRIRFPTMPESDLASVVHPDGLIPDELLMEAYGYAACEKEGGFPADSKDPLTASRRKLRKSYVKFAFDSSRKGPNITVLNGGLTARKSGSSYETILANREFTTGVHYWEVVVNHYSQAEDIFIGVARLPFDTSRTDAPTHGDNYSLLCSYGHRVFTERTEYAVPATTAGSRIGIYLNLDLKMIGFFVNGSYYGTAFTHLADGNYCPSVNLYYDQSQVTFEFPRKMPPLEPIVGTHAVPDGE